MQFESLNLKQFLENVKQKMVKMSIDKTNLINLRNVTELRKQRCKHCELRDPFLGCTKIVIEKNCFYLQGKLLFSGLFKKVGLVS